MKKSHDGTSSQPGSFYASMFAGILLTNTMYGRLFVYNYVLFFSLKRMSVGYSSLTDVFRCLWKGWKYKM